jgi:hypothetical protein
MLTSRRAIFNNQRILDWLLYDDEVKKELADKKIYKEILFDELKLRNKSQNRIKQAMQEGVRLLSDEARRGTPES